MKNTLTDYFRCPDHLAQFEVIGSVSSTAGFFKFDDAICFGQCAFGTPSEHITPDLLDASRMARIDNDQPSLPFDFSQVVDNLRGEHYCINSQNSIAKITGGTSRKVYYFLRPLLPVPVRRHLQKARLRGWDKIEFPRWPVDFSVESLMQSALALILKAHKIQKMPFIWFWPDGAPSCVIMTHDVETAIGLDACRRLMDLDDLFDIKSSFQLIPEVRYDVREDLLDSIRQRGHEVNVHDLTHDGSLFQDKDAFPARAKQINRYAKKFQSLGFRAGAMYRKQEWYGAFDFSYDMSVPNVAHLEPQRGGCCTVMPYFIGNIVELPLTAIQDYSLFNILGDYSIDIWKQQVELILTRHGLISFITHPDYLLERSARNVYTKLLAFLFHMRTEKRLWFALPRDVDQWWRNRNQMQLVSDGNAWQIIGPDKDRARIAYASLDGDRVVYSFD